MNVSDSVGEVLEAAFDLASANQHAEVRPAHLFVALLESFGTVNPMVILMGETMRDELLDPIPQAVSLPGPVLPSSRLRAVWKSAVRHAEDSGTGYVRRLDILNGLAVDGGRAVAEKAAMLMRNLGNLTDELWSEPGGQTSDDAFQGILRTLSPFQPSNVERNGHVFISYVHEDSLQVDRLQRALEDADLRVWRDREDLWPGRDWRMDIRHAIAHGALVFLACFSQRSLAREKSYQNEELALAIEQLRLRPVGGSWLVPVRFDACDIPDLDIGGGRTLASIQYADLFGDRFAEGAARLIKVIQRILDRQAAGS